MYSNRKDQFKTTSNKNVVFLYIVQVARILKVCTGEIKLTTVRPRFNAQNESLQNIPDDFAHQPAETRDSARYSSMENLGKLDVG